MITTVFYMTQNSLSVPETPRHWTESHDWEKGINKCLQFIFASMRQLDECYHSPVTSDNISACSRILENDEEGDFKRVWQRVIALSHSLLLSIRITPLIRKSAASFYITHVGEKKKYWSTISYVFVPWNALFVKNSSLGKRPANHEKSVLFFLSAINHCVMYTFERKWQHRSPSGFDCGDQALCLSQRDICQQGLNEQKKSNVIV